MSKLSWTFCQTNLKSFKRQRINFTVLILYVQRLRREKGEVLIRETKSIGPPWLFVETWTEGWKLNSSNGHLRKDWKVCCVCPWTQLYWCFSEASSAGWWYSSVFYSEKDPRKAKNEKNKFRFSLSGVFKNSHMSSILWFKSECLPRRYGGQNQYTLFWIKIFFPFFLLACGQIEVKEIMRWVIFIW
jgi:hypothetical protein